MPQCMLCRCLLLLCELTFGQRWLSMWCDVTFPMSYILHQTAIAVFCATISHSQDYQLPSRCAPRAARIVAYFSQPGLRVSLQDHNLFLLILCDLWRWMLVQIGWAIHARQWNFVASSAAGISKAIATSNRSNFETNICNLPSVLCKISALCNHSKPPACHCPFHKKLKAIATL